MFGDPTDKALAMCQGQDDGEPFYEAIRRLDLLTLQTDPDETQLVEWMCDRLNEMLFKRVEIQRQNTDTGISVLNSSQKGKA